MVWPRIMSTRSSKVSSLDDDPSAKRAAYDLWFDESGRFMETSTRPEERAVRQDFPSQLVGLLVPLLPIGESARARSGPGDRRFSHR